MSPEHPLAAVASAIGEPARANMLAALMAGRALTATELALEAGVTASTASSHLARLQRAGLVVCLAQGRHRYFRIATQEVASVLEQLMGVAVSREPLRHGPRDERLRRARVCYDHLAGEVGVGLLEGTRARRWISQGEPVALTGAGDAWVMGLGIELQELRRGPRPLIRVCLDWSERREHLAGALGAALLGKLFELRFAERDSVGRAVTFSARGEEFLRSLEVPRARASAAGHGGG